MIENENQPRMTATVDQRDGGWVRWVGALAVILALMALALAVLGAAWGWDPEPPRWLSETWFWVIWLSAPLVGIPSLILAVKARQHIRRDPTTLTTKLFISTAMAFAWAALALWFFELLTGMQGM